MTLFNTAKEGYELVEIDERPVLFTNMRLNRDTVPAGIFCYDVRDSDTLDGSTAKVRAVVVVNHWRTILYRDPFPVDEYGNYYPKDWEYLDKNISFKEFQEADREQLATYLLPEIPQTESVM